MYLSDYLKNYIYKIYIYILVYIKKYIGACYCRLRVIIVKIRWSESAESHRRLGINFLYIIE